MDQTRSGERAAREGIPAATVVIFRADPAGGPPQLLMTVRAATLSFAAGRAVFPGGRVDAADRSLAHATPGGPAGDDPDRVDEIAHRIAAIRETLEETGLLLGVRPLGAATGPIDAATARAARDALAREGALAPVLARFGWRLDIDALIPFARWFPRGENLPRLYDTRFYLADLGTGAVELAVDPREASRLFWAGAQEVLDRAEDGTLSLIYPTRRNLERLARFPDFAAARRQAEAIAVRTIVPFVDRSGPRPRLCIPDDAGYPVTSENLDSVRRT